MRARVRNCHILEMLRAQKRPHISFHTPGHKRAGADITELSYSDNLLSPRGVIARAEEDIAGITGAYRAFLLTDGSTSGVHSMLLALREAGIGRVAYPAFCHKRYACSEENARNRFFYVLYLRVFHNVILAHYFVNYKCLPVLLRFPLL